MSKRSIIDQIIPEALVSARHLDVECVTHIHITMEIVIVTEGVLQMTVSGQKYDISAGYGILIPPLEPHMFHSEQSNRCHVLIVSDELVSYFFEFLKTHSVKRHIFSVSDASRALAERILPDSVQTADRIAAEAVLASLCYDSFRFCEFEEREVPMDRTAYRILEYIDAHFAERITLESVAHAVGIHPVTLSKMLPRQMGLSFCFYVQYVRCAHAARLMKVSSMTLSEIAYESGFGSIRTFNRAFLSVYKTTPSEYRKRNMLPVFARG